MDRFGPPDNTTAQAAIKTLASAEADQLQDLKARFNLGWAWLALNEAVPFEALGELQSEFASGAVDLALRAAWTEEKLSDAPEGLFILGLGKLGGHDLNFSSDIDLIAYYDPDVLPVSKARGQSYVAGQVIKRMTKILMPPHEPNFVYRVDWRLRPEASGTGLAMSMDAAQDFYFFRALPWHRLALMKARVIAGDRATGERFLKDMTPFLWRQNLDVRTIDELASLKSRINLEHPRLKLERQADEPITDEPFGFNVKLGTGGIREIEFIANAEQLIWGGKDYSLRTTNTLKALEALAKAERFEVSDTQDLSAAYTHFRRLENALQMMENGQEHVLPAEKAGWEQIAQLMGADLPSLMSETTRYRHIVSKIFTAMFDVSAEDQPPPKPSVPTVDDLDDVAQAIVDDWMSGFRRYNVRASKRPRLVPLGAELTKLVQTQSNANDCIRRIDAYLGTLSRSEQYLSLLAAHPALLDALINPLLYSPHMSVLLEQSPHIIDSFLAPQPQTLDFVLAEPDYETRLERLRRYVNEGLFQSYHAFLNGTDNWQTLAKRLTDQADAAIGAALTIMRDDLDAPDLRVAVLGLGKLGQERMAPQSDLDLIFLFDDEVDRELASKAVRRLNTILTTPLKEGIAYELDMRLRPSGRSGPPAVTLSAFEKHHAERAKTWEHIALVPARIVAGDEDLGADAAKIVAETLSRPRDRDQLLSDALFMWQKLEEERIRSIPTDRFNSKLREGGLMMADFWDAVGYLADGPRLSDAQDQWTELLYWERLLGLTDRKIDEIPPRYARFIPDDLEGRQARLERDVKTDFDSYGDLIPSDEMNPIQWR